MSSHSLCPDGDFSDKAWAVISVDEALALVHSRARPLEGTEHVPLAAAAGRALAVPLLADRDDPPFDRSMMDGYALRAADARPGRTLAVVGRIAAGQAELPRVGPGQAAWINTGAPLPPGADAVVPVENTRGEVEVLEAVEPGGHVLHRGALTRKGEVAAPPGPLTPERIAVCAAVGADPVTVLRRPRAAILATGAELAEEPGAHEIRNSNGPMLRALLADCDTTDLGTVGDEAGPLGETLARGLGHDVLVTTGGVSKGELDLVRPALERLGVEVVFHGVALQPGKPVLFGTHAGGAVFALPGNPVSALVCARLFVVPYLHAIQGGDFDAPMRAIRGRLAAPVAASPRRQRVFPCRLRDGAVEPLPWRSSADLYTAARADAWLVLGVGRDVAAGEEVTCLLPRPH